MAVEVVMPAMEMAQETARLLRWLKAEGETVREGEPLMEIETDKVTLEVEAPASGVLAAIAAREGDDVPVGQVVALLLAENEKPPPVPMVKSTRVTKVDKATQGAAPPAEHRQGARLQPAPPRARRLAVERGIALTGMTGTGPGGAVLTADVLAAGHVEVRIIPLQGTRKIIAERMQTSYQSAPHISLTLSADMTGVLRRLEALQNVTLTAVLSKLLAAALVRHPRLNAHLIGDEIHEYSTVHLGMAVALDEGLMVPVIRRANEKQLGEIQAELHDLAERARLGRLKPSEVRGSTFTLSNLGMFGIEHFTAILNPPEVGILAVGAVQDRPVGIGGQLVLRPMMQMTLSADHRAVDGAVAAAFLKTLKDMLENLNDEK